MEPRARAARYKGQLNFGSELKQMLQAFGAPGDPFNPDQAETYPETLRVLDEILTDFIIETCHGAVEVANYAGRQKLKTEDFLFVLRKDEKKLGRVQELFASQREIAHAKRGFDASGLGEGGAKINVDDLTTLAQEVGEEGTGRGKGRGKGRKRKEKEIDDGEDAHLEKSSKKARSEG